MFSRPVTLQRLFLPRIFLTRVLVCLAALSAFAQAPKRGSGDIVVNTRAVRPIDGDTYEIYINGQQTAVGLIGVNAPMGNTFCGKAAQTLAKTILKSVPTVTLEEDPDLTFDARSRRSYYLRLPGSNVTLQKMLVQAGLATANNQGKEVKDLQAVQTTALRGAQGCLWSGEAKTAPLDETATPSTPLAASTSAAPSASTNVTSAAAPAASSVVFSNGFVQDVVASGFTNPTSFAPLPDGRILVTEKIGKLWVIENGSVVATPVLDMRSLVNDYWDHGLISVVADPNFATNNYIYIGYTYEDDASNYSGPKTARVSRLTMVGNTASLFSEVPILGTVVGSSCNNYPVGTDCIVSDGPTHTIDNLRFGPDGNLWISDGEGADFNTVNDNALRSQGLDWLAGKIYRINTSGKGLPDNPFYNGDPNANRSKVWAYGLRNPFRFNFRPGQNLPYVGDVGWSTWEEVNVATAGSNLGWPCYEGVGQNAPYGVYSQCQSLWAQGPSVVTPPLITWNHNGLNAASVGGPFYTGTSYPTQYQNAYFYGDYALGFIRYVTVDANNAITSGPTDFATNADGPIQIEMMPDGNLWYLAINTGEVRRIRYATSNSPPQAFASATPTNGLTPLAVQFSSAGSTDPNNQTLQYSWNFGDGTSLSNAANPQHTYTLAGIFTATLTVTNSLGKTATASVPIYSGRRAPIPTITSPSSSLQFKVGDVITYSGSATSPDTGPIPAASLSWLINLHHCPGGVCHIHSFITATGAGGTFTVPDHGDQFYFEIILTATDSVGLSTKTAVNIQPLLAQYTLYTQPPGLPIVGGSLTQPSPLQITTVSNSNMQIYAPNQTVPGTNAVFSSWSDGGAQQHTVPVVGTSGNATATYTTTFNPIRVLAGNGGLSYFDSAGNKWLADTNYLTNNPYGGGYTFSSSANIANATIPFLYQSQRYQPETLSYAFVLPNGSYAVILKFAEIQTDTYSGAGQRVFNIGLNGTQVQSGFDIIAAAGGVNTAIDKTYYLNVTNNGLRLDLQSVVGNATINAIQVLASPVSLSPATASLNASQTRQFTATLPGSATAANVVWSLSPATNSGTILSSGFYTAPSSISATKQVTVTATNAVDGSQFATALITLNAGSTTAPTVTTFTPAAGATNVAVGTGVTATFSKAMTASTINASTITLVPQGSTTAVGATVSYNATSFVATLTPTAALQAGITYTATVRSGAAGVKDSSGTPLAADVSWSFTTAAVVTTFTPIRVRGGAGTPYTDPAGNVWAADTGFSTNNPWSGGYTWATSSAIANTTTQPLYQTQHYQPGTLQYQFAVPNGTYAVTLKFAEIFTAQYTQVGQRVFNIVLNGTTVQSNFDVIAAAGTNTAIDRTFNVTVTGGQLIIGLVTVNGNAFLNALQIVGTSPSAPTVSAVTPTAGATGVAVSSTATTTFSKAMDATSITSSTITLLAQGATTPVAATVSYNATTFVATLTPTVALQAGTTYTANVKSGTSGVKDSSGNPLAADFTWSFTTAAPVTFTPIRVRGGAGTPYTDPSGNVWSADTGYSTNNPWNGGYTWATSTAIANTTTQPLYQTQHYQPGTLQYQFAVPNGTYAVTLKFAEIFTAQYTQVGQRVFDIVLNGTTVQSSFDVIAAAGTNTAIDKTFNVTVTGGQLTIGLVTVNGNAFLNAIQIVGSSGSAPTVSAVTPTSGATGVAVSSTASATFSKAMDATSITSSTITLVPQGSTTAVAATVSYNATSFVATLTPTAALQAGTTYTATVKSGAAGVKDSSGTPLASDFTWSFTTVGTAPAVTTFTPAAGATNVAVGTGVTATFSKAMTASSINASTITLVPQGSTTAVAATVSYNATSFVATLTPTAALQAGTTYTATVKSGAAGVKDSSGIPLAADVSWSFATAAAAAAPTVTTFTPAAGATNVAVGTGVTATFSKAMTASTINASTITLVPQGSTTAVGATVSYNATSFVATLTPTAALQAGITYTATVRSGAAGVKDSSGTPLAADVSWSFTTAAVVTTFTPIRVRGGAGTPYTDPAGNVWAADTGFSTNNPWSGGYTWATSSAIANTTTQPLYQTQHYQPGTLQYQFAVPNGTYAVTLKFAEIFTAQYTQVGQRVFNIVLNGTTVQSNFDVIAAAGTNTAIDRTFNVTVTGGQLIIGLVTVNGNAFLNALQIVGTSPSAPTVSAVTPTAGATGVAVSSTATTTFSKAMDATSITSSTITLLAQGATTPVAATVSYNATTFVATLTPTVALQAGTTYTANVKSGTSGVKDSSGNPLAADFTWSFTTAAPVTFTPIRVRGGAGTPYTDPSGNVWSADTGYSTNNPWNGGYTWATSTAIANTTTQPLYQTQHYQPGTLQYQFAVPNGTYAVTLKFAEIFTAQYTQVGQRVFDIVLNGTTVQSSFDVIAAAGTNTAIDKTFNVTVTGGQLTIGLVTVNGNAFLNAIQVVTGP